MSGRLEGLPGFPGVGTFTLPASEAHAFTVHEVAQPRMRDVEDALTRTTPGWLVKLASELLALLAAADRSISPDDLVFAATARCRCGAGLCYVKWVHDTHGAWVCSGVLLGMAAAESVHDKAKPFAFWGIKSDQQPSANGATTRPEPKA